jgi:hypothetical protein
VTVPLIPGNTPFVTIRAAIMAAIRRRVSGMSKNSVSGQKNSQKNGCRRDAHNPEFFELKHGFKLIIYEYFKVLSLQKKRKFLNLILAKLYGGIHRSLYLFFSGKPGRENKKTTRMDGFCEDHNIFYFLIL